MTEGVEAKATDAFSAGEKPDSDRTFRFTASVDATGIRQMLLLYHKEWDAKNWATKKSQEGVERMLAQPHILVCAFLTDDSLGSKAEAKDPQLVGFGIVTGDFADPLLEDIIVDKEWRGKGLGALIMKKLLRNVALRSPSARCESIDLYCQGHLMQFYSKFGFVRVRGGEGGEKALMRLTELPQPVTACMTNSGNDDQRQ